MPNLSLTALIAAHWLANRLSLERASALGSLMARTFGGRTRRNTRALANMAMALPDTTPAERDAYARLMWDTFGRTIGETLLVDQLIDDPTRVTLANPQALAGLGADRRGTVFVGLHFGNWEVMTIPLMRAGIAPVCVYRPLKDTAVNDWLVQQRTRLAPGGLFPVARAALLRLTKHVRSGGAICVAADHRDSDGLAVPFFGRPAPSVALPAMLGVRYGARVIAVRIDRLPGSRFSVLLQPIEVAATGDAAADTLATTAAIQSLFEAWIRADPGRWLWFYKRWGADAEAGPDRPRGDGNKAPD